jgi:HK97 family phage major capsid protein
MIDVAYVAITAPETLAFTVKNNFFNDIPDPNLGDAIEAIFSILTYGEYTPNVIVLNPSTIFHISTLKDTTGKSLDLVSRAGDGRARIGGRLVIESTAIAPGFFLAGDMQNGAALVDYTFFGS